MRIAIIGSRNCPPIDIAHHLPQRPDTIVSGGAMGADSHARRYAVSNGIPIVEYLPDYRRFGRQAPILRNIQIVENSDFILAFWDGASKGTAFTLNYAKKHRVPYKIVRI